MNKKNIINKTVSVDSYLCSVDGDIVYDLMQHTYRDNGYGQKLLYWGASGNVFYTKDETVLKELNELRSNGDIEKIKEFLTNNQKDIHSLEELKKNGVKLMKEKEFHAFRHLSTPEACKDTLKNNNYGCAHLIEDDKILIFYQNHLSIKDVCTNKNLNIQKNYQASQEGLLKAYKAGKIEPDGELTGGALDKVMNSLLDMNYVSLSKYQKEMVLLLQEFNDNILVNTSLHTKIDNNKHIASFTHVKKTIKVEIPKEKNDEFIIQSNGSSTNVKKVADLLSYINKEVSEQNVNSFLKKRKI